MLRFLFFCALLLPSLAWAQAQEGQAWKRQLLGEFTSESGEELVSFLHRVAPTLHLFSRDKGQEACGAIGTDGQRFSIQVYTDGVPQGCAIHTSEVSPGFVFSGQTLHSHPWQKILVMTPAARAWSQHYKDGNAGAPTLRNDGSSGFSKADRANGDGWLVAGGQLLQLKQGKTLRHGPLDLP